MLNINKIKVMVSMLLLYTAVPQAHAFNTYRPLIDSAGKNKLSENALLNKFKQVCKQFNGNKKNYTLAGIMNVHDKRNPDTEMKNVNFLFCKSGGDFYYRVGQTVTINEQGLYLFIDQGSKAITLTKQKTISYDQGGFKQFGDLAASIKSENYTISSKVVGDQQTISLINEHHISCKQYALTFNKATLKISHLYMRFTNFNYPEAENDQVVDIDISQWNDTANLNAYMSKNKVVKYINGDWKTLNEFKNYRVVKM
jgi:hypothetical protein